MGRRIGGYPIYRATSVMWVREPGSRWGARRSTREEALVARIGKDRKVHIIEPAPTVPDTPEPLTVPAPSRPSAPPEHGAPATSPTQRPPGG